ncbi:MAG: tyrosine-protein phosphatase [Rubrivivax sp.]|nr:tyrosine-protein phosphatase [Rubrivivax sp.]MBK8528235.1 tyrosine-protein phosphatase [Rubrivivax sp.]
MPQYPDRSLRLSGASNFRDLGGYPGRNGRSLCWRRLFRSDHLAALTAGDQTRLAELGVARAFDFRGTHERAAAPYQLPGLVQHALPIEPTVVQQMQALIDSGGPLSAAVVQALMQDLYRRLVSDEAQRFAELFEQLLATEAPLVFHCTAGKDRTGVAAALILLALGVPRPLVMQDFLLSNQYYRRPQGPAPSALPADALAVLSGVQAGFLNASLQLIDDECGGVDAYLSQHLRLSPAALDALAARYLQPA